MLKRAGFALLRTRGSHRIYGNGAIRVVVPFHGDEPLHPKIVRQILKAIADADSL